MPGWPRQLDLSPEQRMNRRMADMRDRLQRVRNRQVLEKPQTIGTYLKPGPSVAAELDPLPATGGDYLKTSVYVPSQHARISVSFWYKIRTTTVAGTTFLTVGLYADGDFLVNLIQDAGTNNPPFVASKVNDGAGADFKAPLKGRPATFMAAESSLIVPSGQDPIEFGIEFGGYSATTYYPYEVREARLWVTVE